MFGGGFSNRIIIVPYALKELVNHVGKKVQVKATVLESEGQKQISVSAYKNITE